MYSLLIDTHSSSLNIILYKNHSVFNEISENSNNQSKIVIGRIDKLLKDSNISLDELNEIIVVNGPGSFTGVRIGVTIAKTFSYALNIPIYSVSSLEIKALSDDLPEIFTTRITDTKGSYIGEFDSNRNIVNIRYLDNKEFEIYKQTHFIYDNDNIKWDLLFQTNYLKKEDCYNIKPIYIKKIEVEK